VKGLCLVKVMVCGKGGSGKSALTVLMARVLSKNYEVNIVDSDESNALLPKMLGAEPPRPLVEYLGGKGNIFKRGEIDIVNALAAAGRGVRLADLPREYTTSSPEGIRLVSIGKVREYGEGCACPFNFLARALLKRLILEDDEVVLVDTDAGVEHLGRGVEEGCDAILTIVDPTAESLVLAEILNKESTRLGKKFWLVANKITPSIADAVTSKAKDVGLETVGLIRFDKEVFKSSLEGVALKAKEALADVEAVLKNIGLIADSSP
jgi:CO dehydrogenase maturation factor